MFWSNIYQWSRWNSHGIGYQNTLDIVASCAEAGTAARICYDLILNGYSDWFLPSVDELHKLYLNRDAIGGFVFNDNYWSSTEYDNFNAWEIGFDLVGNPGAIFRFGSLSVRPIRTF